MLVLRRKPDEDIVLRDRRDNSIVCRITVIEIEGKQARIGVDAPRWVAVNRKEIDEAIQTSGHDEIAAKHAAFSVLNQSPGEQA